MMETMKIIDAYDYGGTGYAPFLIGDKWQVAFLNYAPEEALESIVKLDVHHYTDEVFVLLDGRAALIGAQVDDGGRLRGGRHAASVRLQHPPRGVAQDRDAARQPGSDRGELQYAPG